MVATDEDQDATCLHGINRRAQCDAFQKTRFEERGGETGTALNERSFKGRYTQNSNNGYPTLPLKSFERTEWSATEPIPLKAIATSLPASPIEVASEKSRDPRENEKPASKEVQASPNRQNGTGSHPRQRSPHSSSGNMSSDSATTVYKELEDHIHYPQPQPPSDETSGLVSSHEKFPGISEGDLRRLLKLRRRVQLLRLQIQGQREVVEQKREAQSRADEQYIKRIRTNHVTREPTDQMSLSELFTLEDLWKLCQAARDAYGPAEDSLLNMESRLEAEEGRLERIEERFYQQLDQKTAPLPCTLLLKEQEEAESQDSEESSRHSSENSRPDSHNDYEDYLWRLGNLDLLQERYHVLNHEKLMLEEEQSKRRRFGMELDAENNEFLNHFEDIIEPVRKEMKEASEDVERLKQVCIERGLMDADGNPTMVSANEEESIAETGDQMQSEMPAEHSKPSQNQEPSGNNDVDSSVFNSHGGFGPFINPWLLHKLRSSAMEILIFACYVAAAVKMDRLKWQDEAIRLWDQDGAENDAKAGAQRGHGSYITPSIRRGLDEKNRGDVRLAAVTRKAFSLRSVTSWISVIKFRPKAKSTT